MDVSVAVHFVEESSASASVSSAPGGGARDVTVVAALGAEARVLPRVRVLRAGAPAASRPATAPTVHFAGARAGDVLSISAGAFGAGARGARGRAGVRPTT